MPARGWIAMGNRAYGLLFASGTVAVGAISMGPLAVGLVAIGGFGVGLFAFGGMAVGLAAMGGAAVGYLAKGGGALGWLGANGGAAVAHDYAMGGGAIAAHANDAAAEEFMRGCWLFRDGWVIFNVLVIVCWILPAGMSLYFKWRRRCGVSDGV